MCQAWARTFLADAGLLSREAAGRGPLAGRDVGASIQSVLGPFREEVGQHPGGRCGRDLGRGSGDSQKWVEISEDGGVCVKDSHSVLGPAALATRWPLQGPLLSPPSCDYFLCSSPTS